MGGRLISFMIMMMKVMMLLCGCDVESWRLDGSTKDEAIGPVGATRPQSLHDIVRPVHGIELEWIAFYQHLECF